MVSPKEETLIYGTKVSTVCPGTFTGQDINQEPTNMDLAMKLHYLRGIYYFKSQAMGGLTTMDIKEPMFTWFNRFYATSGRLRRTESGRPYIKCNDCGARFIEAHCAKTLEEWLEIKDEEAHEKLLVPHHVIGPELAFSPLVFLQLTKFSCGGVSVGLSWAHILGDAFSAAEFMNGWGHAMSAQHPAKPLKSAQINTKPKASPSPTTPTNDPLSTKRVGPVGDNWVYPNSCKMETFSFNLTATQITHLQSKLCGPVGTKQIPLFESICALIWKIVAKTRNRPEPKVVTICKSDSGPCKSGILGNDQVIKTVEAQFSVMEAQPKELAELIINQALDERPKIEDVVKRDNGLSDLIVYGANLTFVDLEGADLYGLEFNGQKPTYVGYKVDGVGEEGLVLVLPGPKNEGKNGSGGKVVTLIVPENQVVELKSELSREFSIA
ncbi:protein ECERIFERUM 26-like [Actinidia eriantha]|uniref:protein ECERIFERUM 26-like n=1 Tax=Actinidia eriantha TaxID=165200 RepID=UPI00258FABAB|nr:protein ECERIFERUM 26-like [Actinidia eriantha]